MVWHVVTMQNNQMFAGGHTYTQVWLEHIS